MTKPTDITRAFEAYKYSVDNWSEKSKGSHAIAIGRAAGLAYDSGLETVAKTDMWSKLPSVVGMPTLAEFRAGYEAHRDAFAEFRDLKNFPVFGTDFSNAAGSYAYALDNAARGKAALAGGEAQWAGYWGAAALAEAGFPEQAAKLNQAIVSGKTLETVKAKSI